MTDNPESETCPEIEATAGWLTIISAVMEGKVEPRAGVARLRALQSQYPSDAEWLAEQIETLRWTFALDVEDAVGNPACDYWDKFLSVTEALVEERLPPRQAVALLEQVRAQYPEQGPAVQKVIDDVMQSPLWQIVGETDA